MNKIQMSLQIIIYNLIQRLRILRVLKTLI